MAFSNNVMIVRHKLLADLVRLWKDEQLVEEIETSGTVLRPQRESGMEVQDLPSAGFRYGR